MYSATTLENGIRVVTESMPETRSVSVGIMVDAGPRDEPLGSHGLAHLAEHMMFQGTGSRSARDIALMMDESGGQMGAFTTRDYTCYTATVLDDYTTYALDLMGDILLNSVFPEEALEKEKHSVLREIDGAADIPSSRAHDALKSHVWGRHPLGRPVAGFPEVVRRLTRADLIYFVHRYYLPDRMIVAAAGNVNHGDFLSQVRDAFWRMLGTGEKTHTPLPSFAPGVVVENVPVSQAYFAIGLRCLPYADEGRYGVHLLNSIIGGGSSSRLYARLREERGLVYRIGSEYHAYADDGMFVIEGSTAPEYLTQVLCLVLVELWKLASGDDPVSDEELWKARMQLRAQHLISSENSSTRMSRLATQAFYFDRFLSGEEILSAIDSVDKGALAAMAGGDLARALGDVAISVVGPEGPETFTRKGIEALLADFA
ncbi:M16 family metallopeptidase [Desulfoluna spongiiphila]|uniref:Predicted Zn-dependent peptidase n=1 Tax=Desulfoluna spongiiphila TaxID=419481 RepID=A0A1G5CV34_9BACT|nr:pitrilysin family protein [Desulfoluna spongiiphila]SCY06343.1 Predicted Zn-dependent peptidase [Desulfoluna spongiiphila]